jgi:COPI associated protein
MSSAPKQPVPASPGKSSFQNAAESAGSSALKLAKSASHQIVRGANRLNAFVADNHWSLKVLSIIGFVLVLVFSILAMIQVMEPFKNSNKWIINFYLIFFSLANLICEAGDDWPVIGKVRQFTFRQFGFLKHNFGRGSYNIFFGLIFCTLWGFPVVLVGVYVICVGLLFMAAYKRGAPTPIEQPIQIVGNRT